MSYIYRRGTNNTFVVGTYTPENVWIEDKTYSCCDQAAARVNFLNGGRSDMGIDCCTDCQHFSEYIWAIGDEFIPVCGDHHRIYLAKFKKSWKAMEMPFITRR